MERREIREYKEKNPLRKEKAQRARNSHEGKIPIILLPLKKRNTIKLKSEEFLVSSQLTVFDLIYAIRRSLSLPPSTGFYLYVQDILPVLNTRVGELFERFSDDDGLLYMVYSDQEDKGFT